MGVEIGVYNLLGSNKNLLVLASQSNILLSVLLGQQKVYSTSRERKEPEKCSIYTVYSTSEIKIAGKADIRVSTLRRDEIP